MKAVVVEASPNRDGSSVTLARGFLRGLTEGGGAEVTEYYLPDMHIEPCIGCWKCLKMDEPGCVLDDDMTAVYPRLYEADMIVLATPIYWWHINSRMKAFIDRLEGLLAGGGLSNLSGKALVLIVTYLAEDPDGVYLAIRMFRSIAGWAGMELHVLRYCSADGHVNEAQEKIDEAYRLGKSLRGWEARKPTVPCPVEGCKGRFVSVDALARHLASAAGATHSGWRSDNGFEDLGMADDANWMGIAERLRGAVSLR